MNHNMFLLNFSLVLIENTVLLLLFVFFAKQIAAEEAFQIKHGQPVKHLPTDSKFGISKLN